MALTKTIEYDNISVSQPYSAVSVRKATVIKEDGVEISRNFERYFLTPGNLDASDNLVDTDLSAQPASVVAICNAAWTSDAKASWKAKLIADKPSE